MKCKVLAIFSFQVATRQRGNDSYFPRELEKMKQKEKDRFPDHVTNVGMPMVKNKEWTSCLGYPQQRISSSIEALIFTGFKNIENDWKKN